MTAEKFHSIISAARTTEELDEFICSWLRPGCLDHLGPLLRFLGIDRPNSAGDPGRTAPPVSRRRAFIVESVKAALISLLNLSVEFAEWDLME